MSKSTNLEQSLKHCGKSCLTHIRQNVSACEKGLNLYELPQIHLVDPLPHNLSAADDFEIIWAKIRKISIKERY